MKSFFVKKKRGREQKSRIKPKMYYYQNFAGFITIKLALDAWLVHFDAISGDSFPNDEHIFFSFFLNHYWVEVSIIFNENCKKKIITIINNKWKYDKIKLFF